MSSVSRPWSFLTRAAVLALIVWGAASCAYYNTFYLAKKYYNLATDGAPYALEKTTGGTTQNFTRAIDYSKKVIEDYPRSKWVDDAYLLWARALLGRDDPLETVNKLLDFDTRYPKSSLKAEARFYLGVAYRQARKYRESEKALGEFLAMAPKDELVPYAYVERARALASLKRWSEAAESAGGLIDHYPKSRLYTRALLQRAEALFAEGEYTRAREDFHTLGNNATTDDERLSFMLREADCLEAAREFPAELALLRDALSHEVEPAAQLPADQGTGGAFTITSAPLENSGLSTVPAGDRFGRILVRVGTAQLQAGQQAEALETYRRLLRDYPRTPLGAEAQYRIGYVYETSADDFERARVEYARVKDEYGSSPFTSQAAQRMANLDQVAKFRTAGGDTTAKKAEAGFLTGEIYLFQLDKPERALEEYRKVAHDLAGTPYEAKALNAQAWVLSRKLSRKDEADSLFWEVVRHHPATEAQLAARDYLEQEGQIVPEDLIQAPTQKLAVIDTSTLTPPPALTPPLGGLPGSLPGGLVVAPRDSLHPLGRAPGDSLVGPRLTVPRPDTSRIEK